MKKIISKQIIALSGDLLSEEYFKNIRERLFNNNRYKTKEESGINNDKKTVLTSPGFGSNDRGVNQGVGSGLDRDDNETDDHSVSSGYNTGDQADEETGPGNSTTVQNPYYGQDVFNGLFLNFDIENSENGDRDAIRKHVTKLNKGYHVIPSRRYTVEYN